MAMASTVRDIMTPNPVALSRDATVVEAAKEMKMNDIGDVIVQEDGKICGIVTDRDIVVRALADGGDVEHKTLGDICTDQIVSVSPEDPIDEAVKLMREHAIRRLPVCEGKNIVGIVSLGDLAIEKDKKSALGEISRAPANV
jgi:CBS domain-containing protein